MTNIGAKFKELSSFYKNLINLNWKYAFAVISTSLIVTSLLVSIRQVGGLHILELIAYDNLVSLKNDNKKDQRILIIEITESDIQKQNRWPLADETIALLLQKLQKYQPKVIGLDLIRNIPHPPGSKALQEQLRSKNIIGIKTLGDAINQVPPPNNMTSNQIGFNDLVLDVDDKLRRNLLYARFNGQELYSFSLRLSLSYLKGSLKVKDDSLQISEAVKERVFPRLQANSGGYQMKSSEAVGWQVLLNYKSPKISDHITLTEVLEDKVAPSLVKDKIVLIGSTAPSLKDFFYTPYAGAQKIMPGVVVHAQMVSQILGAVLEGEQLFWFWQQWVEIVWIGAWSLLGGIIAWQLRHPLWLGVATVIAMGTLWGFCWLFFIQAAWIPLVPPALAFIITVGSVLASKVLYTALYDSLTGLPNRGLFTKKLNKLGKIKLRSFYLKSPENPIKGQLIAVLCLDLDRFKLINDGLGYQAGDKLLIATAKRLKAYLKSKFLLARVGADEFAIAIPNLDDTTEAIEIANQLENELTVPFQLNGQNTYTTFSIGIASNKIDSDFQAQDLLLAAHTAMYKAKLLGKARHEVFATRMHEQALARLQLEADLREAIKEQEFELYYQPIISFKTGKIVGFESLIRWHSPKRGFVSPGDFIPITEETGLIIPLGKWILEQACRQMCLWQQQFTNYSSLLISVNLSSRQFSQPNLVEQIEQILVTTGLNQKSLKLEITESMVMDDVENAITLLHRLKDLGLQLSMDDFGTGFSSFSYLHRFPMDVLKVDRSFVSNMSCSQKNQEIVNSIIMLAHQLGMEVIAEGIETEIEMKILKNLTCEYGQGYFFSKPVAADVATKLLEDNPQWKASE
jgi:diguanylate cyclase (GGDEF)-like protein